MEKEKIIKTLEIALTLSSAGLGVMGFIITICAKKLGGGGVAIGGMFSIASLIGILVKPIIGKGIDRRGGKWFLVMGMLSYGVGMGLFMIASNMTVLYSIRILIAFGGTLVGIAAYAIAENLTTQHNKGEILGKIDRSISKGALYGGVVAILIYTNFKFKIATGILFCIYAVSAIIGALVIAIKLVNNKKKICFTTQKIQNYCNKSYCKLVVVGFIQTLSTTMVGAMMLIYLQENVTTNITLLALMYFPANVIYTRFLHKFGEMGDRYGRQRLIQWGLILEGVVSLLLVMTQNIIVVIILLLCDAVAHSMEIPAKRAMIMENIEENNRASGYSVYTMISGVGAIVGPLLGGLLYDKGGYWVPFCMNGLALLMLGIVFPYLFKKSVKVAKIKF